MKSMFGPITNTETGESKDIIAKLNIESKDALSIAGALTLIATGVGIIFNVAWKRGGKDFELAEYNTLNDLGLIK